jgi:hypothetical protein
MQTFDEIYVLDLHGNSLKKETSPDGSKDENVFDIRQGHRSNPDDQRGCGILPHDQTPGWSFYYRQSRACHPKSASP